MTLKFYMVPGSCSTGIHILLEELELPFEVTVLNMPAGDQRRPAYLAINPKEPFPSSCSTAAGQATWQAAIQAQGREMVTEAFAVIEGLLPDTGYAVGGNA